MFVHSHNDVDPPPSSGEQRDPILLNRRFQGKGSFSDCSLKGFERIESLQKQSIVRSDRGSPLEVLAMGSSDIRIEGEPMSELAKTSVGHNYLMREQV